MMRRAFPAALALLLAATLASAATEGPDPYADLESGIGGRVNDGRVTYYMVHGRLDGSHLAVGPQTGGPRELDFQGCAYMQLRPWRLVEGVNGTAVRVDTPPHSGVVRVVGLIGNETPLNLLINTPKAPGHGPEDLALNTTVEPFGLEPAHEPVFGSIEGWGEATLHVDGDLYPDPARVIKKDGETYAQNRTQGHYFVTTKGFRDDASGDVADPANDYEVHVHIESLDGPQAPSETFRMGPPSDVPTTPLAPRPRLLPTEAHSAHYPVHNTWFGGQATLRFQAEADAPEGANELRFDVHSPSGAILANATLRPALQAPDSGEAKLTLDEFGTYSVHVHGKVSMGMYSVEAEVTPPKAFSLDLWWEEQEWGRAALDGWGRCSEALATGTVAPLQVWRPPPPQYDLPAVAITVGAVALAAAIFVVLAAIRAASVRSAVRSRR